MYIETGKGSNFFLFMTEFWGLQKKYLNGDPNLSFVEDAFWDEVCDETSKISQKYVGTEIHEYVMNLLLTFINELERKKKMEMEKEEAA